jgi:hypothetical protein
VYDTTGSFEEEVLMAASAPKQDYWILGWLGGMLAILIILGIMGVR